MKFLLVVIMCFGGLSIGQAEGVNFQKELKEYKKWSYKKVPLDNKELLHFFERCAHNGDIKCANILGRTYLLGAGTGLMGYNRKVLPKVSDESYKKAKFWLNMAVQKGDVDSIERLGTAMYILGKSEDEKLKGVSLLVKATTFYKGENLNNGTFPEQAVSSARKLLYIFRSNMIERKKWVVWLHEHPSGKRTAWSAWAYTIKGDKYAWVFTDFNIASTLIRSLPEEEAKRIIGKGPYFEGLRKYESCIKDSVTKFYQVKLACASRGELSLAFEEAKFKALRMDANYYYDKYDGKTFHPEASDVFVGYTKYEKGIASYKDNRFAKLMVTFPSSLDAKQLLRIRDFIASAYGDPDDAQGNPLLGNANFTWLRKDNVKLTVQRTGWPDTTVELIVEYEPMKLLFENQLLKESSPKQETPNPFG